MNAPHSPSPLASLPMAPSDPILGVTERSEEHTSELQSPCNLVCRLLLEKKKLHDVHFRIHKCRRAAAATDPLAMVKRPVTRLQTRLQSLYLPDGLGQPLAPVFHTITTRR